MGFTQCLDKRYVYMSEIQTDHNNLEQYNKGFPQKWTNGLSF